MNRTGLLLCNKNRSVLSLNKNALIDAERTGRNLLEVSGARTGGGNKNQDIAYEAGANKYRAQQASGHYQAPSNRMVNTAALPQFCATIRVWSDASFTQQILGN